MTPVNPRPERATMSSTPDPTSENAGPESRRLRRIRVDAGSDLAPGRGSLLGAFQVRARTGTKTRTKTPERRAEPRHQHLECLAWVGWRTWRGFAMNDAVLVNLSRSGARVFLDGPPPRGRDLWLFLETPTQTAVVRARPLQSETTSQGQYAVRVEFREPCPYALFEAAVCGLHSTDPKTRPARTRSPHAGRTGSVATTITAKPFAPSC
jgi:hypothetical protein